MLTANVSQVSPWRRSALGARFSLGMYCLLLSVGFFSGGIWGSLGIALAVVLTLLHVVETHKFPLPDKRLMLLVAVFFACTAALNLQSLVPETSWKVWIKLATVMLPLLLLSSRDLFTQVFTPRLYNVVAIVAAVSAVVITSEFVTGGYLLHAIKGEDTILDKYNRPLCYSLLVGFALMAALWHSPQRRWALPFFGAAMLLPNIYTPSGSAQLALMVGVVTLALARYWPRVTHWLLSLGIFLTVSIPFLMRFALQDAYAWVAKLPDSWHHRVEIWDYISYRIMDKPLFGWGLGSSSSLSIESPNQALYKISEKAAMHPHNVMGQLWVELGLVGLILGIIFLQYTLWRAASLPAQIRHFAMASWASAFMIALFAFNFWTDSFFAAFALSAFVYAGLVQRFQAKA